MISLLKLVSFIGLWTAPPSDQRKLEEAPLLPLPIDPPSASFCQSNELGSDYYVSLFKPCVFTFYNSTSAVDDDNSCNDVDSSSIVTTEERFVMLWPESCVAYGPRCYSMADNPDLFKFTNSEVGNMDDGAPFPADALSVSVTCSVDYSQARAFANTVENDSVKAIFPMILLIVFFLILSFCFCAGGTACCCGGSRKTEYVPVAVV